LELFFGKVFIELHTIQEQCKVKPSKKEKKKTEIIFLYLQRQKHY